MSVHGSGREPDWTLWQLEQLEPLVAVKRNPAGVLAEVAQRTGRTMNAVQWRVTQLRRQRGLICPRRSREHAEKKPQPPPVKRLDVAVLAARERKCCRCRKPFEPATPFLYRCDPCRKLHASQGKGLL